jgi:hypothetical protein
MRGLAAGILVSSICSAPLTAQERDRSLERINLALEQPSPLARHLGPVETSTPATIGIFTVVPPVLRGEMIRVSLPIGAVATRAFKGVAAANQRRKEAAAKRRVEAELKEFLKAR